MAGLLVELIMKLKMVGRLVATLVALFLLGIGGLYGWLSSPDYSSPLVLPSTLVDVRSDLGQTMLSKARKADYTAISTAFEAQQKLSWCGVASATAVLRAKGQTISQNEFFSAPASAVRSWWQVTFGGLSLADLQGMLEAHGAEVKLYYADQTSLAFFRKILHENADNPKDWIVVNYDRKGVGQKGSGHISPISAYEPNKDMLLVHDTASYKYPPHWVEVEAMYNSMDTIDSGSERSRGWLVIR